MTSIHFSYVHDFRSLKIPLISLYLPLYHQLDRSLPESPCIKSFPTSPYNISFPWLPAIRSSRLPGKDEHLPIGEGFIDHKMAIKTLKDIDYDKRITLEVFTNSNDAKSSADKLKAMW